MIDRLQEFKGMNGSWVQFKDGKIVCIESRSYSLSDVYISFHSDKGGGGPAIACFMLTDITGFGDTALIGAIHEG